MTIYYLQAQGKARHSRSRHPPPMCARPGNECSDHLLYSKGGRRFILYLERTVWHNHPSHTRWLGENDTLVTVTFHSRLHYQQYHGSGLANGCANKRRPRPDDHPRQPATRPDQRTGRRLRQHRTCRNGSHLRSGPATDRHQLYTWSVPAGAIG